MLQIILGFLAICFICYFVWDGIFNPFGRNSRYSKRLRRVQIDTGEIVSFIECRYPFALSTIRRDILDAGYDLIDSLDMTSFLNRYSRKLARGRRYVFRDYDEKEVYYGVDMEFKKASETGPNYRIVLLERRSENDGAVFLVKKVRRIPRTHKLQAAA